MEAAPIPRTLLGKLVRVFLTTRLALLFLIASLLAGWIAVVSTPREEEPQIVVPMADVLVSLPGASATEVETLVAAPLEKLLWQIDGVEHVYSMSRRGGALVTVRFHVGEDRERSLVKLQTRIAMHIDAVPLGVAGWVVKPMEIDDVPIVTVALHSRTLDPLALRRVGEEVLHRLDDLADLSRTEVVGGLRRRILVRPDPLKLAAYGIPLLQLNRSISAADASLDAGHLVGDDRVRVLSAGPFLSGPADVAALVVGVHRGNPVRLEEVATVEDAAEEVEGLTRISFGPASGRSDRETRHQVTLALSKKKGTNAVTVAAAIRERLDSLARTLIPPEVEIQVTRDQGRTADAKVDELLSSLAFAIVSVVLLLAVSMGWREGLVVALSVPVSFSLALVVNALAGYTINRVTLFALILSLGLVVDDPITNVDNIQRHLRMRRRQDPVESSLDGIEEVLPPVLLSTLAIIVSFLPMAFITGMMGPYMQPMAMNVPLTVTFSTVAALTVVPWIAFGMLSGQASGDASGNQDSGPDATAGPAWVARLSRFALTPFLRSRKRTAILVGVLGIAWLAASLLPVFRAVPLKMLPFDDKDELQILVDRPEGSSLERTDAVVRELEARLVRLPELHHVASFVGLPSPMDFNGLVRHSFLRRGPHLADLRLVLRERSARTRTSHALGLALRPELRELEREHGVRLSVVEVPPGPPVLATLVAEIRADASVPHSEMVEAGRELAERMRGLPGVVDLRSGSEADRDRIAFRLDREKASLHGVDAGTVAETLGTALGGRTPTLIRSGRERQPLAVEVRLSESDRSRLETLADLEVQGTGARVALAELGTLEEVPEDQPVVHKDLSRVVLVEAELAGRAPVEVVLDLQASLATRPLAGRVRIDWAGEGEWKITLDVFRDLGIAFGVALVGIYLLLVFQTGSFATPLLIMVAIPLTGLGIMPGFWVLNLLVAETVGGAWDGVFFTATGMIGMIALGGIVVRNSIVLIEFIEEAIRAGADPETAIVESNAVRFRPIVLTALTTAIGALPITFDPIFSGLAWSLIFGLVASTGFTLLVVPVLYRWLFLRTQPAPKPQPQP